MISKWPNTAFVLSLAQDRFFLLLFLFLSASYASAQRNWSKIDSIENHFPLSQDDAIKLYLKRNGLLKEEMTLRDSFRLSKITVSDSDSCIISIVNSVGRNIGIQYVDADTLIDLTGVYGPLEASYIPFHKKRKGEVVDMKIIFPESKQYIITSLRCDYPLIILSPELILASSNEDGDAIFMDEIKYLRIYLRNRLDTKPY